MDVGPRRIENVRTPSPGSHSSNHIDIGGDIGGVGDIGMGIGIEASHGIEVSHDIDARIRISRSLLRNLTRHRHSLPHTVGGTAEGRPPHRPPQGGKADGNTARGTPHPPYFQTAHPVLKVPAAAPSLASPPSTRQHRRAAGRPLDDGSNSTLRTPQSNTAPDRGI
ncbi:hypothetical protein [Streptomyces antimicrobicus]|uniref:Uncharacterized protein n=1 Tax=Streptomyces antimicrobicus TaxID=2883108 RepID=A0ABS8B1W1_9ACTN|nr:hypothetical protein [Streptomyces antimicrobicus]MCB5178590.1 hypothetical protein [Streptomyces antimicrobicus]